MVSGVNSSYINQYNKQAELIKQKVNSGSSDFLIDLSSPGYYIPSSVSGPASTGLTAAPAATTAEDGKDDGSIGIWGATKNLLKGGIKFFTGMFTDENGNFSLGQTLKTALTVAAVGAVCVLTAGTAVPAILATAGIGLGAFGMAKAGYNIATAETDAEAEAAWQSLGSNTVATGLAVAGAKAVAKGAHATEAAAGEFDGISGTIKAVKMTAHDAAAPFSEAFNAAKTGYQAGGLSNAAKSLKANSKTQFTQFKGQVVKNYNNAIYGVRGKYDNEANDLKQQNKDLAKEAKEFKKNSPERIKIEQQIEVNKAKIDAISEMKGVKTTSEANDKIYQNQNALADKKLQLAQATDKADKAKLTAEIEQLQAKIDVQESYLKRIKLEDRNLAADKKGAKGDNAKQLAEKETEHNFSSNSKKVSETTMKNANKAVDKAQEAFDAAQTKVAEAQSKLDAATTSAAKKAAQTELDKANVDLATKAKELQLKQNRVEFYNRQNMSAQKGRSYSGIVNEFGREVYNVFANTKKDPTATLLALGIAGRSEVTTTEARFVEQLSPQEKAYYQSLPYEQKQALIERYAA